MLKKVFIYYLIIVSLFSCITRKNLLILGKENEKIQLEPKIQEYTLMPGDVIDIKISGLDNKSVELFNKRIGGSNNFVSDAAFYLNGYIVDDSLNIDIPMLGKINVEDKTVADLNIDIKNELSKYLNFVTVYVKLVNFRVTILGEVQSERTMTLFNKETTILQAIGLAGGISDFGDRNNILLIRKEKDKYVRKNISLNDPNIIESEFFYVMPNDLIYIRPLRVKAFQKNAPSLSLIVSSITLLTVILNISGNL